MNPGIKDRWYWIDMLERLARPVLEALSQRRLKELMPVEYRKSRRESRELYTHLEALGRLLAGMAPWLELSGLRGKEERLRSEIADLARQGIQAGTDPDSPDFMNFSEGHQPIVDASFLAQGMLHAPRELWEKLDAATKRNVVTALRATRSRKPGPNNWLLFAATIETFFCKVGEEWDPMRIDYAVRQHNQWYKGDGMYGDGPEFHWDYYNSFVIHPMLVGVILNTSGRSRYWDKFKERILRRAQRYAVIQERLISPEGAFPPMGRSLTGRIAAFQLLGLMALLHMLPESLSPAQVRCALTAVIRRTMEAEGTFDKNGWLTLGFCGHQPGMAEDYFSTGSMYMCSTGLLPLGLPPEDEFWASPPQQWTSQLIWSGQDMPGDHALEEVEL